LEHPQRFYKYVSPDVAKIILTSGRLRWSCPLLFDDPAEFKRMPRFDPPIDQSYGACADALIAFATNRAHPARQLTPASQFLLQLFRLLLERGTSEEELRKIAREPIVGSDQQAKQALEAWVQSLNIETARILCVSTDSDNPDLWVRYAANYAGAVLEFRHLTERDTPLLAAVRVDYADDLPVLAAGHDFLLYGGTQELRVRTLQAIFFTKRAEWSCQHEWRALTWRPHESTKCGDYRFFPDELVSVRCGAGAAPSFRQELSSIVATLYPGCEIG
jgi:hypothetical protein